MESIELRKKATGEHAADMVKDGDVVGLGTGSTAYYAIKRLGEKVRNSEINIVGIPTSIASEKLAIKEGITLSDLTEHPHVNITIDGADEVSPELSLIKGLGGALLREKLVAFSSEEEVIIADDSKIVSYLGEKAPLPVEVIKFGWNNTLKRLKSLGCNAVLRKKDGQVFVTDEGNYIIDCKFEKIDSPYELSEKINNIPGVIENGLFLGIASKVVIADESGVKIIKPE